MTIFEQLLADGMTLPATSSDTSKVPIDDSVGYNTTFSFTYPPVMGGGTLAVTLTSPTGQLFVSSDLSITNDDTVIGLLSMILPGKAEVRNSYVIGCQIMGSYMIQTDYQRCTISTSFLSGCCQSGEWTIIVENTKTSEVITQILVTSYPASADVDPILAEAVISEPEIDLSSKDTIVYHFIIIV